MAFSIDYFKQLNKEELIEFVMGLLEQIAYLKNDNDTITGNLRGEKAANEFLSLQLDESEQKYNELMEKYTTAKRYMYGTRSEKRKSSEMLDLIKYAIAVESGNIEDNNTQEDNETQEDNNTQEDNKDTLKDNLFVSCDKKREVKKRSYDEIYKNIPKRVEIIDTLDKDQKCECGSNDFTSLKGSKRYILNYIPGHYEVIEQHFITHVCNNCGSIISSDKSQNILDSHLLSPNAVSHIAVECLMKDVPLYRQEQYLKQMETPISRATMNNSLKIASEIVEPIYNEIWKQALSSDVLHVDETPFLCLKTNESTKKNGYIWVYANKYKSVNPFVYYAFSPDRKACNVQNRLGQAKLTIMTDGYAGYSHVGKDITRACCIAHCRRQFFDAYKLNKSPKADWFVKQFDKLYEIESLIKNKTPEKILEVRREKSYPIFNSIIEKMNEEKLITSPSSKYGSALDYLNKFQNELQVFLNDGNVPIDNNQAERMVKFFVLYKKNSLFANTEEGAKRTAILNTIVQTARLNKINVEQYLSILLTELENCLQKNISNYLPWSNYIRSKCGYKNIDQV